VAVANNPVVTASSPSGPLQLCLASGTITVHGSIEATYAATSPPSSRAVNIVQLSQYLDDVVPSESSPYWGTLGPADGPDPNHNPWGFQALEAQAVAARSYVLSTPNGYGTGGYADTCDQTASRIGDQERKRSYQRSCCRYFRWVMQFAGQPNRRPLNIQPPLAATRQLGRAEPFTPSQMTRCRVHPGLGLQLQPEPQLGSQHPRHHRPIGAAQIGSLQSIAITAQRLRDWGTRDHDCRSGSSGSATLTGSQFAGDFNLPSNWFTVTSNPSGGVVATSSPRDGGIFTFGTPATSARWAAAPEPARRRHGTDE